MDGNGRWAAERGLPRRVGHQKGVDAVRRAVKTAIELNISYLTIYSFSSENWSRPEEEIHDLMGLMKRFIRRDLADLHKANVRIRIIGERSGVDSDVIKLIDEGCEVTKDNTGLNLIVAFNYGSRDEIAKAARLLAEAVASGEMKPEDITAERLGQSLDTAGIPDPDLLIRTSGELRLSNFLLWQSAYTEFVFLDAFWPEFDRGLFEKAIAEFHARDRRYGGLTQQSIG